MQRVRDTTSKRCGQREREDRQNSEPEKGIGAHPDSRSTEGSGLGNTKQMGAEYSGDRGRETKERRTQTVQERPGEPDL